MLLPSDGYFQSVVRRVLAIAGQADFGRSLPAPLPPAPTRTFPSPFTPTPTSIATPADATAAPAIFFLTCFVVLGFVGCLARCQASSRTIPRLWALIMLFATGLCCRFYKPLSIIAPLIIETSLVTPVKCFGQYLFQAYISNIYLECFFWTVLKQTAVNSVVVFANMLLIWSALTCARVLYRKFHWSTSRSWSSIGMSTVLLVLTRRVVSSLPPIAVYQDLTEQEGVFIVRLWEPGFAEAMGQIGCRVLNAVLTCYTGLNNRRRPAARYAVISSVCLYSGVLIRQYILLQTKWRERRHMSRSPDIYVHDDGPISVAVDIEPQSMPINPSGSGTLTPSSSLTSDIFFDALSSTSSSCPVQSIHDTKEDASNALRKYTRSQIGLCKERGEIIQKTLAILDRPADLRPGTTFSYGSSSDYSEASSVLRWALNVDIEVIHSDSEQLSLERALTDCDSPRVPPTSPAPVSDPSTLSCSESAALDLFFDTLSHDLFSDVDDLECDACDDDDLASSSVSFTEVVNHIMENDSVYASLRAQDEAELRSIAKGPLGLRRADVFDSSFEDGHVADLDDFESWPSHQKWANPQSGTVETVDNLISRKVFLGKSSSIDGRTAYDNDGSCDMELEEQIPSPSIHILFALDDINSDDGSCDMSIDEHIPNPMFRVFFELDKECVRDGPESLMFASSSGEPCRGTSSTSQQSLDDLCLQVDQAFCDATTALDKLGRTYRSGDRESLLNLECPSCVLDVDILDPAKDFDWSADMTDLVLDDDGPESHACGDDDLLADWANYIMENDAVYAELRAQDEAEYRAMTDSLEQQVFESSFEDEHGGDLGDLELWPTYPERANAQDVVGTLSLLSNRSLARPYDHEETTAYNEGGSCDMELEEQMPNSWIKVLFALDNDDHGPCDMSIDEQFPNARIVAFFELDKEDIRN